MWSLSHLECFEVAWQLFKAPQVQTMHRFGGPLWQSLLAACENQWPTEQGVNGEARLLAAMARGNVGFAAKASLAMRLAQAGRSSLLATADVTTTEAELSLSRLRRALGVLTAE